MRHAISGRAELVLWMFGVAAFIGAAGLLINVGDHGNRNEGAVIFCIGGAVVLAVLGALIGAWPFTATTGGRIAYCAGCVLAAAAIDMLVAGVIAAASLLWIVLGFFEKRRPSPHVAFVKQDVYVNDPAPPKPQTQPLLVEVIRCPKCQARTEELSAGLLRCLGCGAEFERR